LDRLVIGKIKVRDRRVLVPAGVGEDCGVLDLGGDVCVVSGDPVTGAKEHAGRIAVHVACNDIATCGVRPLAILSTLLLPPDATEDDLEAIFDDIADTAESLDVSVIGGHTEVTDAVTRVVISITAIGAAKPGGYVTSGGALAGDSVIMTKSAAIEGAAILAAEREETLRKHFGETFIKAAKLLADDVSVIQEGVMAGTFGVHAMHDVTEGGALGALWELAAASGKGIEVFRDQIPVLDTVKQICAFFGVDPYRLISSGSMLIATDKPHDVIMMLGSVGIAACEVARILENPGDRYITDGGEHDENPRLGGKQDERSPSCGYAPLPPPGPDELYRALNKKL
jgi:hydrogenase maturation factor